MSASPPSDESAAVLRALDALHARVDGRFAASVAELSVAIGCGSGCFACCLDDLGVWEVEAARIRQWVGDRGVQVQVRDVGACAFLDAAGRCQVYAVRPYVCRSQGAVLAWHDEEGPRRATCEAHLVGVDLSAEPERATFELGPAEDALLALATRWHGATGRRGLPERVALRALAEQLAGAQLGSR